jgi:histidinol phosphatase-like enzyme
MDIIEDNNFLSQEQKNFIDETITSKQDSFFNYFISESFNNSNYWHFSHLVLSPENPEPNSSYYNPIFELLNSFCKKHNIKINRCYRININITFNINKKRSLFHKDHDFNHKQCIIYLNDCDLKACTLIKKNNKIIKIKPKKYKAVCFDNLSHSLIYPRHGMRVIAVYTFN